MKPAQEFKSIVAIAALFAMALTASCSPQKNPADAPLTGFVSDKGTDLFGYYLPMREIRVGRFRLDQLSVGAIDDFRKYEAGNDRIQSYAPVMLGFSDVSSPRHTNELGQTYFENAPRALPSAYRVMGGTISFVGGDKQIGHVAFSGKLDVEALKAARDNRISDSQKVVLRGDLTIAGKTFKGVTFGWFGGD